jgi:mono/diheme cytochrome c family protein
MIPIAMATALFASADSPAAAAVALDTRAVYQEHCATCHGTRRNGGYAPPLIPQTLGRKTDETLARAIASGLPNTQMAAFGDVLDEGQTAALVALLREPVTEIAWSAKDIAAANQLPAGLVVLDAHLRPLKVFPLEGQPSAVYHLPGGNRFVLTLLGVLVLYSVRTSDLPPRTVASSRGGSQLLLYDYERERILATLRTQGLPHLFSACFFSRHGAVVTYDSESLEERGRLPYAMPVGKYNAGNKTRLLH